MEGGPDVFTVSSRIRLLAVGTRMYSHLYKRPLHVLYRLPTYLAYYLRVQHPYSTHAPTN